MPDETQVLEQQNAQRDGAKRATFAAMKAKARLEDDFPVVIGGEVMSFLFRSVGGKQYDKLIDECGPTPDQMARGMQYDEDKFAPELLSRVCVEPAMPLKEWQEIWSSPDWTRGERMNLFGRAVALCLRGLEPGPTVAG